MYRFLTVFSMVALLSLFLPIGSYFALTSQAQTSKNSMTAEEFHAKMSNFEREHMAIQAQNSVIQDQLRMVLDLRRQVITATEDLHYLTDRLKILEVNQSNDPPSIAVLQTQVAWLLRGLGVLILGCGGWMVKSMRDSRTVLSAVKASDILRSSRHDELVSGLREATATALRAVDIGMEIKDHPPGSSRNVGS